MNDEIQLLYDERDDRFHEERGSKILYWLDDLGAKPLRDADVKVTGFLFAGARAIEDYQQLVSHYPTVRDRPDERLPLLQLDTVLERMPNISVPQPRTWTLGLDEQIPDDICFPLFVRTAKTSWKLGGKISRVTNRQELQDEADMLRRALQWDAVILARQWLELEPAGASMYGPVPQEIRVWIVDGVPVAWSFHHLHIVNKPKGFPPTQEELKQIKQYAIAVGSAFSSRLVAADFVKQTDGQWVFLEAGPGSCAGTAHEKVFKAVAERVRGRYVELVGDDVGGAF